MITVNPIFINEVLSPLIGGADNEADLDKYGHYRSDYEDDVKQMALKVLLPEFINQKEILQSAVKNSLAYYLIYSGKVDFESIFNSLLLPIETPRNAKLFFQWIWEVFFPGEFKEYIENEVVMENFDVNAPFYLLTGIGGGDTSLD